MKIGRAYMKSLDKQHNSQSSALNELGHTYKLASFNVYQTNSVPTIPLENYGIVVLISKPHLYNGYMNGYRQPVGLIRLRIGPVNALQMQHLQLALTYYFPAAASKFSTIPLADEIALFFGDAMHALQKMAGLPIFDDIHIEKSQKEVYLWVPTLYEECLHQSIALMLTIFNHHGTPVSFVPNSLLSEQMNTLVSKLRSYAQKVEIA